MNGVQSTDADFTCGSTQPDAALSDMSPDLSRGFMHPKTVASDHRLTPAEKRALLASWASDVNAVPGAPALRQLGNGAVVRVDDILRALKSLDERENPRQARIEPYQPALRARTRVASSLKSYLWRSRSDDDDDEPPPCPAMIMRPLGGPLSGGETAEPSLMLAA